MIALVLNGTIATTNSFATEFNGRTYTQISDEWYEVYNGVDFKVISTEVIVRFSESYSSSQIDSLLNELSADSILTFKSGSYLVQSVDSPQPDPLEFCEAILNSGMVEYAFNVTEVKFSSNDPLLENQVYLYDEEDEGLNDINWLTAWNLGVVGHPSIRIGIIDSGLLFTHQDMICVEEVEGAPITNIAQNLGEDVDGEALQVFVWDSQNSKWIFDLEDINNQDDDFNGFIDDLAGYNTSHYAPRYHIGDGDPFGEHECWHGTPVTGIIGALTNNDEGIAGIAGGNYAENKPGCSIVFAKIGPNPNMGNVVLALEYIVEAGEVRILNGSWGSPFNEELDELLEQAYNNGIFMTFSAGNGDGEGGLPELEYPANNPFTFAVGGCLDGERHQHSNFGENFFIVAPWFASEDYNDKFIALRTTRDGNMIEIPLYLGFGGTSGTAPQVAGVAGLVLSQEPDLNLSELTEVLGVTAFRTVQVDYEDMKQFGLWNEEMGYGKLDAGNAVIYGRRQVHSLGNGWNWISSRMIPFYTEANGLDDENGIFLAFDELVHEIDQLKNLAGNFWTPDFEFNNIPNWNYSEGYLIKVNDDIDWVMLGKPVDFDEPIEIVEGWNMVAYYPDYALEAEVAFESIEEDLEIAKNQSGQFYAPAFQFNNMAPLSPGFGYQVKSTSEVNIDLIYPEAPEVLMSNSKRNPKPSNFIVQNRTADFYPVIVSSINIPEVQPIAGDEVGAFNQEGRCIGSAMYNGEFPIGLSIWENDTSTVEEDGFVANEPIYIRYLKASSQQVFNLDTLYLGGNLASLTKTNAYAVMEFSGELASSAIPTEFKMLPNYPNPFNSSTIVEYHLPHAGSVKLSIFDVQGRLVNELETIAKCQESKCNLKSRDKVDALLAFRLKMCYL